MAYPPFEEYQEALRQPPRVTFTDPVLATGRVVKLRTGEPHARSGNFALTYQVETAKKRYAVRCFHKPCESLAQRYDAIERWLIRHPSPYFVDFEFQPEGIRTESGCYPIVRMDWADGVTLAAYVADHHDDGVTLQQLRASLRVMARQLAASGLAHGDIQPANVIVRDATDLKLVDYDGMYVPELARLGSIELGQRNFRHPGRRTRHYDHKLDAFPFAVIDLAVGAIAYRPELWQLARCDESAFVLRAEDFTDPWTSHAFGWLHDVPGLDVKTQHLAAICQSPYEEIPSIEDFLAGRNIPAPRIRVPGSAFRPHRPIYLPAFPVVDAENVAQCCSHIGDQVELIGQVRRARTAELSLADGGLVRVEFGEFPDDMAVLQIHAVDAHDADDLLDQLRTGAWVSAIGLVEPPRVERVEGRPCKMVSVQITHRSQLTRLPDIEAQHRLISSARNAHTSVDLEKAHIGTDPALAGTEPPTLAMERPAETAVLAYEALIAGDSTVVRGDAGRQFVAAMAEVEAALQTSPPAMTYQPEATQLRTSPAPRFAALRRQALRLWAGSNELAHRLQETLRSARRRVGAGRPQWPPWAMGSVVALTAAALVIMGWRDRTPRSTQDREAATTAATSQPQGSMAVAARAERAPDAAPRADRVPETSIPPLLRTSPLQTASLPIATRNGSLSIGTLGGHAVLRINDQALGPSRARSIHLTQQAFFADREVITGLTDCADLQPGCAGRVPFWLTFRDGAGVSYRRLDARSASGSGEVTALPTGIHVDLGVWDGFHRTGMLTHLGDAYLVSVPEPSRRLDRNECREVLRALESCASISGCRSLRGISRALSAAHVANVRRLFHETTGLDSSGFRSVCLRSCELGMTPTREFVQRRVCGGAQPGQWQNDVFAD